MRHASSRSEQRPTRAHLIELNHPRADLITSHELVLVGAVEAFEVERAVAVHLLRRGGDGEADAALAAPACTPNGNNSIAYGQPDVFLAPVTDQLYNTIYSEGGGVAAECGDASCYVACDAGGAGLAAGLSLIHISEPTRLLSISEGEVGV